ncbi:MAG: prepilin-type N-terminal cleavage/methylation domain-containing protein [Thermodesulfobacteriota bacterium]|nr:prepilin-type N-terminal cleavage/methylation domain-containing protein [Thermodesulfobacteriota bacterium]
MVTLSRQQGFTLIELMVAATIFIFVVLAAGAFYVFTIGVIEEGSAKLELQRNGSLAMESICRAIREGKSTDLAEDSQNSLITIYYPEEPYDDGNFNGIWDNGEVYRDINNDSYWNCASDDNGANPMPIRSFQLAGGTDQIEEKTGNGNWSYLLDNRYPPDSGHNSVYCDILTFIRKQGKISIDFILRDDMQTLDQGDDIKINFHSVVHLRGG